MNIEDLLKESKVIQNVIDDFIDVDENIEENFQNLIETLYNHKIQDNHHMLRLLLHIIANIANNHYREINFFSKIERIILLFSESIKANFTNQDIFNIFRKNKRILLFLIKENIFHIDNQFINKVFSEKYIEMKYPQYFTPEIKSFLSLKNQNVNKKQLLQNLPDNFENMRQIGENDDLICQSIQKDSIEDFIIYINKTMISLNSYIKPSIFETNPYLLHKREYYKSFFVETAYDIKKTTLIEYAAFFGSVQIFKYLYKNGVSLTSSLWLYSIHGNNPEIIHILEGNHINPEDDLYIRCLNESIKCHHNNISNYIKTNYIDDEKINESKSFEILIDNIITKSLKYYNFIFVDNLIINEYLLYYLCRYDNSILINMILRDYKINVNQRLEFNYDGEEKKDSYKDGYICKKGNTGLLNIDEEKYMKLTTALITAVEKENIEVIKILLKHNLIDVNIPRFIVNECFMIEFSVTETVLQIAVEKENEEIVKYLLSNDKINPNLKKLINSEGSRWGGSYSSLHTAVMKNNAEIVKTLISSEKVNPNIYSFQKAEKRWTKAVTALHAAIEDSNIEIVKILLDSEKTDPNIYVLEGHYDTINRIEQDTWLEHFEKIETPLDIAFYRKDNEVIKLLLLNKKIKIMTSDLKYIDENEQIAPLIKEIYNKQKE